MQQTYDFPDGVIDVVLSTVRTAALVGVAAVVTLEQGLELVALQFPSCVLLRNVNLETVIESQVQFGSKSVCI
jgi:hypothetical protein